MLMQISSFSIGTCVSQSNWEKANQFYNGVITEKERSKIYSDFDETPHSTYDILTSVWKEEDGGSVVLNIKESLTSEKNIERVSCNYFYMFSVIYSLTVVAMLFTLILLFKSEITTGESIVGIFIALAFSVGSTKVLNESKKRVVLQWQKTQNPK